MSPGWGNSPTALVGGSIALLPSAAERDRVAARVRGAGVEVRETAEGHTLRDPAGNAIVLAAPGAGFAG